MNPRTIRALGLGLLVTGLLAAAGAYGSAFGAGGAPGWAGPVLGVASILMMAGCALLAVARPGAGPLAGVLLGGTLALAFAMASVWTLAPADPADPRLYLGLPRAVAHLLFGIGIVPAIVIPLVYAWTFDRATLSPADLERVRAAARAGSRGERARGPGDGSAP